MACDVTDEESVAGLAEAVGGTLNVLVNNAGGAFGAAPVAEADSDDWRRMFEVNVIGLVQVTRALLPALIASGDGMVLNVGSTAGRIAYEGGGGYTAAKHGTQVVSETLRLELWDQPVRVCEIAPGMVRTDEFALVRFDGDQEKAEAVYAGVPDPLTAEDIADAITWMATRPAHVNVDELVIRPRRAGGAAQGLPRARAPWKSERMASGMKTIGLVGGMSWESSAVYYRDLNLGVQKRLGGLSSPRLVMSTVDFAELTELEDAERWDQVGALLAEAGRSVERAGADFLLLCTTTFHKVADQVAAAVDIPLLHLADVVAEACAKAGVTTRRLHRHDGRDVRRLLHRPDGQPRARGAGAAGLGARLAELRDLRGARARARARPDPAPGGRADRPALGRRRRGRAARLHRARAAHPPGRRRPPGLPVHHAARRGRPGPRALR